MHDDPHSTSHSCRLSSGRQTHKRSSRYQPHGRGNNDDTTHSAKGEQVTDCPGARKETNEGRNVTQGAQAVLGEAVGPALIICVQDMDRET